MPSALCEFLFNLVDEKEVPLTVIVVDNAKCLSTERCPLPSMSPRSPNSIQRKRAHTQALQRWEQPASEKTGEEPIMAPTRRISDPVLEAYQRRIHGNEVDSRPSPSLRTAPRFNGASNEMQGTDKLCMPTRRPSDPAQLLASSKRSASDGFKRIGRASRKLMDIDAFSSCSSRSSSSSSSLMSEVSLAQTSVSSSSSMSSESHPDEQLSTFSPLREMNSRNPYCSEISSDKILTAAIELCESD